MGDSMDSATRLGVMMIYLILMGICTSLIWLVICVMSWIDATYILVGIAMSFLWLVIYIVLLVMMIKLD